MAKVNDYGAPEVFDLGKSKEVILGDKGCCDRDPVTGEPTFDPNISEVDE